MLHLVGQLLIYISDAQNHKHKKELPHAIHTRICTYLQDTFQTNIFWHSVDSQSRWDGQAILGQMCIMHSTAGYAFSLQVNEETMTELLISHNRIRTEHRRNWKHVNRKSHGRILKIHPK